MIIVDLEKTSKNIINNRLKRNDFDISTLSKALDTMYPGMWDMQYNCSAEVGENYSIYELLKGCGYYLDFIIHFPEIEITNGKNKHLITDLYVNLRIDIWKNNTYLRMLATRESYTLKELHSGYAHSHLCGINMSFSEFCLGSGPLTTYVNTADVMNKTYEEWLFFLNLVNQYIRWESIAGRPYRYIDNIGDYGNPPIVGNHVAEQIVNKFSIKNIKYKILDNQIKVIPSDGMEEELVNALSSTIYKSYLCYKNPNGEYLTKAQASDSDKNILNYNNKPLFKFKGKLLTLKILNEKLDEKDNYITNAPVPDLTRKICEKLSNKLTKAYIKRSRIGTEDTSKSPEECGTKDKISVPSYFQE